MNHPGVKTLLDRIAHQNNLKSENKKEDTKNVLLDIIAKESQPKNSNQSKFAKLADFKDSLKQRMKNKRKEIRKEEEEEAKIDEEYHPLKKKLSEEENINPNIKQGSAEKEDSDSKENSNESNQGSQSDSDSDDDFRLNLGDDDENDDKKIGFKNQNRKDDSNDTKKKHGKNVYEFDSSDESDTELKSIKKHASEIPLTNTIPSNQLKNTTIKKINRDPEVLSQDGLFLEDSQHDKSRRSLDELTNISFNYETNSINNASHNNNDITSTSANSGFHENENESDDEVVLDELAMLCSGQFRAGTQKKKQQPSTNSILDDNTEKKDSDSDKNGIINKNLEKDENTTEKDLDLPAKSKPIEIKLDNQDLFVADDGDDEDMIKPRESKISNDDANSNDSKGVKENSCDVEEKEEDEEEEEEKVLFEKKKATKKIDVDSDSESDTLDIDHQDEIELLEQEENSNQEKSSNEKKKEKEKKKKKQDGYDSDDLENQGYFEEEAELSGSDAESDEDDEGESDKEILFSGDEDELPSDSELKEQLGKIYLKDQIDQDNKDLRLFKEMYLKDGEFHQEKGLRKKKFLWKNLDAEKEYNNYSSEDEEDEDEDDDDEENKEGTEGDKLGEKLKKKDLLKTMSKRNWRSIRHEREQFHATKKNENDLLSDNEENIEEKNIFGFSESSNSNDNPDDVSSSKAKSGGSLLKKGQLLLKGNTNSANKMQSSLDELEDLRCPSLGDIGRGDKVFSNLSSQTKKNDRDDSNMLKKFSFLNRDKSYLTRLSSYVNKNISNIDLNNGQTKSITRRNNMVFTSLANDQDEKNSDEDESSKRDKKNPVNLKKSRLNEEKNPDSMSIEESKSKRLKYDTCESIFNHIN